VPAPSGIRKRIRRDPETTKGLILDVTEKLMVQEGYAAVSSRRIAQELGLNAATVHYYFPTTDDVFIALHRQMTERQLKELERVMSSGNPLQAFWEFQSGWAQTALGVEFLALSNHRKAIRDTLAASTNDARQEIAGLLAEASAKLKIASDHVTPALLATVLIAIGRLLANEERVGITQGHEEVRSFVASALTRLSGPVQRD
jgi:TetR/AcrR family transcriptional regulator, regulator of autoinduction and epiphytic fitness